MPNGAIVLDLDITGLNINNKIINEPHVLSNRPARSIATNYGPFFAESVIVKDGVSVLLRGTDYQIVELHQEATLLYAKEISSVIIIINSNISSNVTVTYQALGGYYTRSDKPIANLYQSVINDNRPIDWTNLFNKPTEFNPAIHRHLLEDIYGFEPVVDYLERIKRAITLGQTSVVLEIVNSLITKFTCQDIPKVLPSNKILQYDALLYFLSRKKILNNIWVDKKDCAWYKGDSAVIQVDTSGYQVGTILYWELYNSEKAISLFATKNGSFRTNGSVQEIQIYVPAKLSLNEYPLYLGIKENLSDIDYKAVTYLININDYIPTDVISSYLIMNDVDYNLTAVKILDVSSNDELRLYHMLSSY